MGLRILHTADLHLGADFFSYNGKSAALKEYAYNSFLNIVEYGINPKNNIDILIIAGDLFDNHNPDKILVGNVKKELNKLIGKNILLYLIPGNHDSYGYSNSVYRNEQFPGKIILNKEFGFFESIDVKNFKVHLYGGIFNPGQANKRALKNFNINQDFGFHIGLLHGTYENGKFKGVERDLPFDLDEFKESGLNYLALGHYHSFFEINVNEKHKAVYPGSVVPRKITEYGKKYFTVIDIDTDYNISVEKVSLFPIKSEKYIIDLNKENISDEDKLIEFIKNKKDKNLILDLVITGYVDFRISEEKIYSQISDDFYFVRLKLNIDYVDASKINLLKEEQTIRGLFFKELLKNYSKKNERERRVVNKAINLGIIDFVKDL